jgi:serine O-acetyltransferase
MDQWVWEMNVVTGGARRGVARRRKGGPFGKKGWLLQPGYWAVRIYRFGRWTIRAPRLVRPMAHAVYFAAYSVVRLATGIDIPRSAQVGADLMIHHYGGIIVHPQARIGDNCVLRHGVTIGEREEGGPVPVIGNNVNFGAYSLVLGGVRIGDGAKIGALSLVMSDVPAGATAVGVPARILPNR